MEAAAVGIGKAVLNGVLSGAKAAITIHRGRRTEAGSAA
jgi:hypothetical protein